MKINKLSIVVPVFNNKLSLELLVSKISETVFVEKELIFVDDGSTDKSWETIVELKKKYGQLIKGIRLSKNYSQAIATIAGMEEARSDALLGISADLQDPPELIQKMLSEYENRNIDVVIAFRENRKDGLVSKFLSWIAYYFARLESPDIPRGGYDFFLISDRVRKILLKSNNRNRFPQSEILNTGFAFFAIPYTRKKREYGKSGYTLFKKFRVFIDIILSESSTIFKIFTKIYLFFNLVSLIFLLIIIILNYEINIEYYAMSYTLILLNLILINQIINSVINSRIYEEQKGRPLYNVSERC